MYKLLSKYNAKIYLILKNVTTFDAVGLRLLEICKEK